MSVAETDELLLAELSADTQAGRGGAAGRSLSALIDALEASSRGLSGGIELATALEELQARGLVERGEATGDGSGYVLTEAGEERASAVRDRLADVPVTIVNGESRELALPEAADALDRSLVEVAADCTADGVYYRDDEPAIDRVVGREAERERCRSAFEAVRDAGRGRAVYLTGPGGVGKTTLARQLVDDASDEFEVLRAACRSENETFGAVRELLADLEPSSSPFDDVGAAVDDPDAFRAQQTALFHDVTELLLPEPDTAPRLVFVDDLHLADPATIAYLEYLVERLPDLPLLVLGTSRSAASDGPASTLASGGDEATVAHVRLSPLDRDATRDLVEQVVGRRGAPGDLVGAVYERTGGNPLFVEETVSRLLETDQLDPRYEWYPSEPASIDVPEAVTETIERRVDDLDPDARHLLRWAAVIGERIDVAVLRAVCDLPGHRVETLIEALVETDVFDRTDDRTAVVFRTEVVRNALLDDFEEEALRRRHDTVAGVLEESVAGPRSGDEPSRDDSDSGRTALVAEHHERAGNDVAAIEWYREAGERATAVYAHDAAIEHYHSALALARDGDDAETFLAVAERLAKIYTTMGDFEAAGRYTAFARERADGHRIRQRLSALSAKLANARGDFERGIEETGDALALVETPSTVRCRLLSQRVHAEIELGRLDAARETARRMRETAAAIDDPQLEARATERLGSIDYMTGDYETGKETLVEALEHFETAEDALGVARTRIWLGGIAEDRGEFERAAAEFRRSLEGFRSVGHRSNVARTRANLANVAIDRGDYETGREHLRQAIEEFRATGDEHTITICRRDLGIVALKRGEYATAATILEESLEAFREREAHRHAVTTRLHLGRLLIRRREYDDARTQLTAARETAESVGLQRHVADTSVALGSLALARRDHETASERLRDGIDEAGEIGYRRAAVRARRRLGELAIERQEFDTAEERLDRALEGAEAIGDRHAIARTRRARGELAVARGETDVGTERVRTALETFAEIGATAGVLEALGVLVDVALEGDEDERARQWLERASDRLETVPDDEVGYDGHREWVADARAALE